MNKIRFKYEYGLIWNENGEKFDVNECEGRRLVCDKLNKQQSLINALKKENKELKEDLKKGFDVPIPYVENSMRRLRAEHKVGELQATIEQLEEEIERLNGLLFGTPKAIE